MCLTCSKFSLLTLEVSSSKAGYASFSRASVYHESCIHFKIIANMSHEFMVSTNKFCNSAIVIF